MTMTIRDVKTIAMDRWNRYYCWKMYPKWVGCLGAGIGFLLVALILAFAIGGIKPTSIDIPVSYINQVNIAESGSYTITRYFDGHMIINQDDNSDKSMMMPYTNEPIPDSPNNILLNLLRGFFLFTLLAGAGTSVLYIYRYASDRFDYAEQQAQLWMDSISRNLPAVLPTTESVIEFAKHIQEGGK